MKLKRVIRPDFDVETNSIRAYMKVFFWRMWIFFSFPHRATIDYMIGEKKLGEEHVLIFPRIRLVYRRE